MKNDRNEIDRENMTPQQAQAKSVATTVYGGPVDDQELVDRANEIAARTIEHMWRELGTAASVLDDEPVFESRTGEMRDIDDIRDDLIDAAYAALNHVNNHKNSSK